MLTALCPGFDRISWTIPLFVFSVCRCRLYDPTLYNITDIITISNIIIRSGYILIIVSWYPAAAAGRFPDPGIIQLYIYIVI